MGVSPRRASDARFERATPGSAIACGFRHSGAGVRGALLEFATRCDCGMLTLPWELNTTAPQRGSGLYRQPAKAEKKTFAISGKGLARNSCLCCLRDRDRGPI